MSGGQHEQCIACGSKMRTFIEHISDDRYGCPGVYSIDRCVSCGHMSTAPRLTEEDLPALYSNYYPRREIDFNALEKEAGLVERPFARLRRWMAGTDNQGHYLAKPGQKVLDIGCGSCLSLLEMQKLGVECWGVEADPNVRTIAEKYALRVHIGNIYDVPFADQNFDLIVLNQVIEHVPDPLAMLEALKNRLNSGGRVILAFPNTGSFHRKVWKERWINWHIPYHQNHFNRTSFALLAQKSGYDVARIRTITPNLWSVLQLRTSREQRQEGRASGTWSESGSFEKSPSFIRKLRNVTVTRGARLAGAMMGFVNRALDATGQGDSLLVELRLSATKN